MSNLADFFKMRQKFQEIGLVTVSSTERQLGIFKAIENNDKHISEMKVGDLLKIIRDYSTENTTTNREIAP